MKHIPSPYSANGQFLAELWYYQIFGVVPNFYELQINDEQQYLKKSEITVSTIGSLFNSITDFRNFKFKTISPPSEVELQEDPDISYYSGDDGCYLTIVADNKIVKIALDGITIYYKDDSYDDIVKLADDIFNRIPKVDPPERSAKINLIKYSQGDYYTEEEDIKPTTINLKENYNDDFLPVYEDITKFFEDRSSGLVLLYGSPGTGKTTIIRHLCTNSPKDYVIVPNSVATRLGDPDLISFITAHKNAVFVLEDCEQILEDRSDNPFNNAITTILNMADGLLSDILNIKFICTFNAEIGKIDPALTRKGRCIAKYEFKELTEDKVAHLNEKYNLGISEIKPMTLAEIYNTEKTDYAEKKPIRKKIGF